MEPIIILYILGLLVFLALGVPVAISLGILSLIGLVFLLGPGALSYVGVMPFPTIANFLLVTVPLFILMSAIMSAAGMASEIFDVMTKWLGRLPGGLAIASVAACAGFATVTGSSIATVAAVGYVAIPEMLKRGYDRKLAMGAVAAAGALGMLIPPSIPMILYAVIAEESIGKLFMGGVIPGLLLALVFSVYIFIIAVRGKTAAPPAMGFTWKERIVSLRKLWTVLVLIVAVLVSIYIGVATPSESAAVGAFVSLLLGALVYKGLNKQTMKTALLETAQTTAMALFILMGGILFTHVLTALRVPYQVAAFATSLDVSPWVVIILINVILIIGGCLIDALSLLVITMPIFVPVISALGFDTLWFGIVVTVNIELAVITPPVGLNVYVMQSITKAPMSEVFRAITPFAFLELVVLALVIAFPPLAVWLPSTMIR